MTVAKVIEFYIPNNFRKSVEWVSAEQRGEDYRVRFTDKEIGLTNATRVAATHVH